MADDDYAPVASDEDEEERKRRDKEYDYPPAEGSAPAASLAAPSISSAVNPSSVIAPDPSAPPAVGLPSSEGSDLNSALAVHSALPLKGMSPAQTRLKTLTDQGAPPVEPLHGFKKGLDTVGQIFLPKLEQRLRYRPQAEYQQQLKAAEGDLAAENQPQTDEADLRQKNALAGQEEARAAALKNPPVKNELGKTPEETTIHDLMAGDNGKPRINPDTNKPYTYLEAYGAVKQTATDSGKQQPAHITYDAGIPVSVVSNGKTYDVNDPKLPEELKPLVDAANRAHGQHVTEDSTKSAQAAERAAHANDAKRSATEMAQVEREARMSIRKAEGKYRDTQKSVGQLIASIDAAKDGNGLLTSFVPTMEVLGINAANGVHRISPAEAEAAKLPGGFVERFNAWFDKAATGKISPQLQDEGKQLAKILSNSAYKEYKSTYNDEHGIVEGYGGKDFDKRVPMIKDDSETTRFTDGGKTYNIPADKVKDFKKDHPNAR